MPQPFMYVYCIIKTGLSRAVKHSKVLSINSSYDPKCSNFAYVHDPDTTLTFDLKVKFIVILICLRVRPIIFFALTLAYHIWQMSVCVAYVRDSNTTLTTDLKDKFIGILTWLSVKSESNGTSMYHMVHGFCMSLIFDLNINIIIIFTMNLHDRLKFVPWHI